MLLPHGTLIALVDGERFELYRNSGNEAHPELASIDTPKLDEQNKGSGNRHYSSAGNPQASLLNEDAHAAAVVVEPDDAFHLECAAQDERIGRAQRERRRLPLQIERGERAARMQPRIGQCHG